jgi:DNA (cytosine-5)-methyltransferase 1
MMRRGLAGFLSAEKMPVPLLDSKRQVLAIDLFSGCGGLTLGLKQAGFKVIGAVEIDPLSVETYKVNHPEVHVWETDVRLLGMEEVKRVLGIEKGELDLLAGCPPCQGFSAMRTLNGSRNVDDERNNLLFEFLRFVEGLKPRAIMMENVPGLSADVRYSIWCNALREFGYVVQERVVNAADFGVPQRRRRLICLAGHFGLIDFASHAGTRRTVKDAIGRLPGPRHSNDPLHKLGEKRSERILNLVRRIPRNGGSRLDLGRQSQLSCHQEFDGFKDIYGRMAWDQVAPTVTSGCVNPSKGRFLHPRSNRTITLREAALLQSFPSRYFFSLRRGKFAVAEMIGNALPPLLIKRISLKVRAYLSERKLSNERS